MAMYLKQNKKHFYLKMLFGSKEMQSLDNRAPSNTLKTLQEFKSQLQKQ